MKTLKITIFSLVFIFLSSCANISKFPVSNVIPAADITILRQLDKNGNCKITIKAKNMAAAERLSSPKKVYVVWINSEIDGIRNIGQLKNKNAGMAEIKTLTPFKFNEVFVTAEDSSDVSYPTGIEISHIKFYQLH